MRAVQDRSLRLPLPAVTGAEQEPAGASGPSDSLVVCTDGWGDCDHSKLTPLQTHGVAVAEHRRNLSECQDGLETCNYSALTPSEAGALTKAEHQRNYTACLKGYGYCDLSRLTPTEAGAIPPARNNLLGSARQDGGVSLRFSGAPLVSFHTSRVLYS